MGESKEKLEAQVDYLTDRLEDVRDLKNRVMVERDKLKAELAKEPFAIIPTLTKEIVALKIELDVAQADLAKCRKELSGRMVVINDPAVYAERDNLSAALAKCGEELAEVKRRLSAQRVVGINPYQITMREYDALQAKVEDLTTDNASLHKHNNSLRHRVESLAECIRLKDDALNLPGIDVGLEPSERAKVQYALAIKPSPTPSKEDGV